MFQLTPNQTNELLNIVNVNQNIAIGKEFGVDFLTDYDKSLLRDHGVDISSLYNEANDTVFTSFHFGMLSDSLEAIGKVKKITYDDLKEYIEGGNYIPLTLKEKATINSIKTQSLTSIKGSGNKIFQDVNRILQDNSRQGQEDFLRKEVVEGTLKKRTMRQIANEIAHKTGDWSRDFDRIVEYMSQSAFEEGKAATIERQAQGEDPLVYKRVFHGACKHCIRLYLTRGIGSAPKIFRLSELRANGTNIGRKVADWKPVLRQVHPYCFDDQTEVLTNQGWKFFKDLNKEEQFMSVNLNTGEGEWSKAVNWIGEFYKGEMYSFQNKNFDLVTTPNHHHVIQTSKKKKLRLVETEKLPQETQFLKHMPKWIGEEPDYSFDEHRYDSEKFTKFLGFFFSEGSAIDYKGRLTIHISQSQEKYLDEIFETCKSLFDKVSKNNNYVQVMCTNRRELWLWLKEFGYSNEKRVPYRVKNSSRELIETYLDSFCKGDGSFAKGRVWDGYQCKDSRLFYTSSKLMADDIGELLLKVGNCPSYKFKEPMNIYDPKRGKSYMQNQGIWVINEVKSKFAYKNTMTQSIFEYEGFIYDVELEKNHTLFVRRNGKVSVSGNCRCQLTHLPPGHKYNVQTRAFDILDESKKPQLKKPRQKIRAIIGGVEVWV